MYVREEASASITIEKSRFIAFVNYCKDEAQYKEYLSSVRRKYYDASHVCSAMIAGNTRRSSDDGEPGGTAGVPILNVLEKRGLDHTCALVVRYFGGIKLGAGGLIRAYGSAVSEALKNAVLIEEAILPKYRLTLPYDLSSRIDWYLENNTTLLNREYGEEVTYLFASDDPDIVKNIQEYTRGIAPVLIGEEIIEKVV